VRSTASIAGHPLHAMLVAFPIALFITVLILDLLYFRDRDHFWARVSHLMVIMGVAWGLIAIVPGLIDFFTMPMTPLVYWHLSVGLALITLFAIYAFLRRPQAAGGIPRVILPLSLLGAALVATQGYLGGELVYHWHVGVLPTAQAAAGGFRSGGPAGLLQPGRTGQPGGTAANTALASAALPIFNAKCAGCHTLKGSGGTMGPDLTHEGSRHDAGWIAIQVQNPRSHPQSAQMPEVSMPAKDRELVARYLASLK
jgi:uncharacterized membrane protein